MTTTEIEREAAPRPKPSLPSAAAAATARHRSGVKTAGNIAIWGLQILVAAAFIWAGSSKLMEAPAMVELFERLGMGEWFLYFTGAAEIAGAILLLVPSRSGIGAIWLGTIMIGAIAAHLTKLGGDPTPAIILLALTLIIAWLRRGRTARLLRETRMGDQPA